MKIVSKFLLITLLICQTAQSQKADMIIFSYDRPMQFYALLESIEKYMTGLDEIHVLYRTSSDRMENAYKTCFDSFAKLNLKPVRQDHETASNVFKPMLMTCLRSTCNDHVIFAVDDIIVKDYVNLSECINCLNQTDAYGFYLRLGKNITECYTEGIQTPVPTHRQVANDTYAFEFRNGKGDWGYPCSVDMTLYKKSNIVEQINRVDFHCPNRFEGNWHVNEWFHNPVKNKTGLFFENSKIINVPLNTVNHEVLSRNMNVSSNYLLEKFENGARINISPLFQIKNSAPHTEVALQYTESLSIEELREAIKAKDFAKIDNLKKQFPNISNIFNVKDQNGYTLLMWAANTKNIDAVKFLIKNKADVNAQDKNKFTALMYACWRGILEIVDILVANKADVDAIDINGTTALAMADRSDSEDKERIITLLIEQN